MIRKNFITFLIVASFYVWWETRDLFSVYWFLVGVGLIAFVVSVVMDAGRAVNRGLARTELKLEQHNVTVEDYGQQPHADPTRPREDLPAVIELERQRRKGN